MIIKAIFSDFDGVFTDNNVLIDELGNELVKCSRSDGIGIEKLKKKNIYFCIVSSETVPLAQIRAKKLKVPCFISVKNKYEVIKSIQSNMSFSKEECAFIGNDINDIKAFNAVGLKIAVSDSYREILEAADLILTKKGGDGAVREACDTILNRFY